MDCQYPQQTPYGMTDSQYQTVIEEMNKHSGPNGTHPWMHEVVSNELRRLIGKSNWRDAYFLVKRARMERLAPMLEDMAGGRILRGPTLVDELSAPSASKTLPIKIGTNVSPQKKTKTNGLTTAMLAGMNDYKKRYGNYPSTRALFDWLKAHDSTDNIVEYDDKVDALVWKRADGGLSQTTRGGPAQLDRNLVFLSEFSAG